MHNSYLISSSNHLQPPLVLPRRITHPNLPKGKEQVTLLMISANELSPSCSPRRITHPNLPKGKEQVTLLMISANELSPSCSPRRITHPNLPKGKEQVTLPMNFSPLSFSPVGEKLVTLYLISH